MNESYGYMLYEHLAFGEFGAYIYIYMPSPAALSLVIKIGKLTFCNLATHEERDVDLVW